MPGAGKQIGGGGAAAGTPGPTGATGPAGQTGLLTGFTGGSINSVVYQTGATTCEDLHTAMLDEINSANIFYKDYLGQYWAPGAIISDAAGSNLIAGRVRVMQQQTVAGGANWRDIDPAGGKPADLVETVNQDYVEFGRVINATQWRFLEPKVDGLAVNPTSRFDGFLVANYPTNAAIPGTRFATNQWTAFDGATPTQTTAQTTALNTYPTGRQASFVANGTFGTRIATDQVTAQAADGEIFGLLQKGGANGTLGVGMRLSGASGTKNGIIFVLDDGQGPTTSVKTVAYVNNVATNTFYPNFTPAHGSFYRYRLQCYGTMVRAKIWLATDPEPAKWMITTFTPQISSGYFGLTANIDTLNVTAYSTVINRGASAAMTGVT